MLRPTTQIPARNSGGFTRPPVIPEPFENPQMELASKSWPADYCSKGKDGGSGVWEGMIYDTQTDLLIFGTGNPTPKGDPGWLAAGEDLYSDSIITVTQTQVSTFGIIRRYPGGAWGMSDATGHIILADLPLAVGSRHVLMSAEKQLFYVLDARTGAFISVNAYLPNTNFSAMNSKTGKLTVRDYLSVWKHPGTAAFAPADDAGGHTWTLCAYNPQTGLVYIPAYILAPDRYGTSDRDGEAAPKNEVKARLVAWDRVGRKERWHVDDQPAIRSGREACKVLRKQQPAARTQWLARQLLERSRQPSDPSESPSLPCYIRPLAGDD
jgi:glucose dehydrogenase